MRMSVPHHTVRAQSDGGRTASLEKLTAPRSTKLRTARRLVTCQLTTLLSRDQLTGRQCRLGAQDARMVNAPCERTGREAPRAGPTHQQRTLATARGVGEWVGRTDSISIRSPSFHSHAHAHVPSDVMSRTACAAREVSRGVDGARVT